MSKPDRAVSQMMAGFSCSQSVFSVFAEDYGLDPRIALKIGDAFGGGIAGQGLTCGAVTGALMVIGLAFGRTDPADYDAKTLTRERAKEFLRLFEARYTTTECRLLLEIDIGDPELAGFKSRCHQVVHDAAAILEQVLSGG